MSVEIPSRTYLVSGSTFPTWSFQSRLDNPANTSWIRDSPLFRSRPFACSPHLVSTVGPTLSSVHETRVLFIITQPVLKLELPPS